METLKSIMHPIHKEGHKFIAIAAGVTLVFFFISCTLFWLCLLTTLWITYFFRDPVRIVPSRPGLIVSPGDGTVCQITNDATPPIELDMGDIKMTRVSIFLNVFDVHVNRIPIAGKIERLYYHAGKFVNASLDKASEDNERQSIWLKTEDGRDFAVTQIAGLIARRIVCNLQNSQEVKTGEKFGIIRFGSRVDLYMPSGISPLVVVGQKTVGGETVIADLSSAEPQRTGTRI